MVGTIYSSLNASEFDLVLHKVSREKAVEITGCKKLPEDVKFFATRKEDMILFHALENNFNVTIKIDCNGVATKCFTESQMCSGFFPASRYWG